VSFPRTENDVRLTPKRLMKLKNIWKNRDENEKSSQTMSNIKDVHTAKYLPDIIGTIRKRQ
jgi:hypothetical protein